MKSEGRTWGRYFLAALTYASKLKFGTVEALAVEHVAKEKARRRLWRQVVSLRKAWSELLHLLDYLPSDVPNRAVSLRNPLELHMRRRFSPLTKTRFQDDVLRVCLGPL